MGCSTAATSNEPTGFSYTQYQTKIINAICRNWREWRLPYCYVSRDGFTLSFPSVNLGVTVVSADDSLTIEKRNEWRVITVSEKAIENRFSEFIHILRVQAMQDERFLAFTKDWMEVDI